MATFDFVIDDQSVGQTIGPPNGFLVELRRTGVGPYEQPSWSEGKQRWLTGYFVLRGSGDIRDLISVSPQSGSGWASHSPGGDLVWGNSSVPFKGSLTVVAVPKGSVWEITLSDVPFVKTPVSMSDYVASLRSRELEPVRR